MIVTVLFLAGCADYSEETWVNTDGSGKTRMEISIAKDGMAGKTIDKKDIEKELKAIDGIKVKNIEVTTKDNNQLVIIECSFKTLGAFMKLGQTQQGQTGFIGKVSFEKQPDGTYKFSRTIGVTTPTQENNKEDKFQFIMKQMMSQFTWTYKVHLPGSILTANVANKDDLEKSKKTVTWRYNVGTIMTSGQTMEAAVKKTTNMFVVILAGVVVLMAAAVVVMKRRKKIE